MCCPNADPASFQTYIENSGDISSLHYVISFKTDSHTECMETILKIEKILEPNSGDRNWIWTEGVPVFDTPITVYYAYIPDLNSDYTNRITTMNTDLEELDFEPVQFNFDKFTKRLSWCGYEDSSPDHGCCPAHRCLSIQPIRYAT